MKHWVQQNHDGLPQFLGESVMGGWDVSNVSNEKRCLGDFLGIIPPRDIGNFNYYVYTIIRIPTLTNQDSMESSGGFLWLVADVVGGPDDFQIMLFSIYRCWLIFCWYILICWADFLWKLGKTYEQLVFLKNQYKWIYMLFGFRNCAIFGYMCSHQLKEKRSKPWWLLNHVRNSIWRDDPMLGLKPASRNTVDGRSPAAPKMHKSL